MLLKVNLMDHAFSMPSQGTPLSAGWDIYSAEDKLILANSHGIVKTGLRFEIPPGFELQVRSRSGHAARDQVFVLNSPGTVDADYRGELLIILMNLGLNTFAVTRGMRIAQIVPSRLLNMRPVQAEALSETKRGEGGFGSTGQ